MDRHIEAAFDLRTFLDEVRSAGELREISGAHWKLESGKLRFEPRKDAGLEHTYVEAHVAH